MEDASPLIAACLQGARPSAAALELAIDCDTEAERVQPEVRSRLERLLEEGREDTDPQRQHIIAEALLARRLRHMIHLKEEVFVDTSLISCAEYQLFLEEKSPVRAILKPLIHACRMPIAVGIEVSFHSIREGPRPFTVNLPSPGFSGADGTGQHQHERDAHDERTFFHTILPFGVGEYRPG